jgi:peptidoglycan/xylan/chitin deacetylase (PgdA/CDA1 family)
VARAGSRRREEAERTLMRALRTLILLTVLTGVCPDSALAAPRGCFVLAFDDGHASWLTEAAPALAELGGVATAFVTSQRITNGAIRSDQLRRLQDEFSWEIGTHTATHQDAVHFVSEHGVDSWLREEVDPALGQLRTNGLRVRALAFPFNRFTPAIRDAALTRVESVRKNSRLSLFAPNQGAGVYPATSVELGSHVPLPLIRRWIDQAAESGRCLSLYAHRVLPDAAFTRGTVESLEGRRLSATQPIAIPAAGTGDLCLAPDTEVRVERPLRVSTIEGRSLRVGRGDLGKLSAPGASFLLGPCYGLSLSRFREITKSAAAHLDFRTVSQALAVGVPLPAAPIRSESSRSERRD